jgi:hypothetical protein
MLWTRGTRFGLCKVEWFLSFWGTRIQKGKALGPLLGTVILMVSWMKRLFSQLKKGEKINLK